MTRRKITPENESCVRCGYTRKSHELGNYADGPMIGRTFLVCPTATWKSAVAVDAVATPSRVNSKRAIRA